MANHREVSVRISGPNDTFFDPDRPVEIKLSIHNQSQIVSLSYKEATELSDKLQAVRAGQLAA